MTRKEARSWRDCSPLGKRWSFGAVKQGCPDLEGRGVKAHRGETEHFFVGSEAGEIGVFDEAKNRAVRDAGALGFAG